MEQAAEAVAESAYGNAGERCLAGSVAGRGRAADPLRERPAARARSYRVGDGMDPKTEMGPSFRACT